MQPFYLIEQSKENKKIVHSLFISLDKKGVENLEPIKMRKPHVISTTIYLIQLLRLANRNPGAQ